MGRIIHMKNIDRFYIWNKNEHFEFFLRPSSLQLTPGSGRPKIAKIPHIFRFLLSKIDCIKRY